MPDDIKTQIEAANAAVMKRLLEGQPSWIDVQPAGKVVPGLAKNVILHAGPPVRTENVVPPLRTTLCGAAIHEGLARTAEQAWAMITAGDIVIDAAQDHACACGAAMATSASTPVLVAEDKESGKRGYSAIHPGHVARTLRWGFYDPDVEEQLCWFRDVYGPALGDAVRAMGGINARTVLAKTAGMGDENHNRQPAASMQLICQMVPALLDLRIRQRDAVIRALAANDRFFLHVLMAASLSVIEAAKDVPLSTICVGMGGNGHEFGLQFSGTGNAWFTVPAPKILGQMLNPSWTEKDVCGFLGDSCITEVYGFGGLSAAAGPSYVRLTGCGFDVALRRTEEARQVCLGEHEWAPIPWDGFRGSPVGIDMRKVVATGIVPTSHGGSVLVGGGQGGIGSCPFPIDCFKQGLRAFAAQAKRVA